MKFINHLFDCKREELIEILKDNKRVNERVIFDPRLGMPYIHYVEKGDKVTLKCEYMDRPTKDNGFIYGTRFNGKITDEAEGCRIKGVITTEPIYHIIFAVLFIVLTVQGIIVGGIGGLAVPICLVITEIFMYKDEFKKQGIIDRYIQRAYKRLSQERII